MVPVSRLNWGNVTKKIERDGGNRPQIGRLSTQLDRLEPLILYSRVRCLLLPGRVIREATFRNWVKLSGSVGHL